MNRLVLYVVAGLITVSFAAFSQDSASQKAVDGARDLLRQGSFAEARKALDAIVTDHPDDLRAWYLLGRARQATRAYEAALLAYERAAEAPKLQAVASYGAACANAQLGEIDAAFGWLEEAKRAGFANYDQLLGDAELATIRGDARFAAFLPPPGTPLSLREEVDVIHVFDGEAAGDQFGWIGRNAGDCDGDGTADILISAPYKTIQGANAGRIYVYSGKTGALLFQQSGKPGSTLGIGIEGAGDANGDGHADVIAGASGENGGQGAAYVYSGKDGKVLHRLAGEAPGDGFGRKVAGAGDVNGDGHDDVVVGAPTNDAGGTDAGRAYVFSGKDGTRLVTLTGEAAGQNFGRSVDGHSDETGRYLIIGAPNAGEGARGAVFVFTLDGELEARPAFTIESTPGDTSLGLMFVSAVGDVDGDGVIDVYGSDWSSNANGKPASGRIYVHSGKDGRRLHTFAGEAPGDGFGIGTAEAGDVDGDGCDDLIIGAWQNDAGSQGAGRCYLYSGKTGAQLATYTCENPGETFGFDTTNLGDVDGDGTPDFLITGAYSFVNGARSGRVAVISGRRAQPNND